MSAIEVLNVSKVFHRHAGRQLLRERIQDLLRRRKENVFHALSNVSFSIAPGESVAIIGANGAGKSTLLSLIAGLAPPDEGSIKVSGRIAALLELGSGFHPDLTGVENISLNAALLGFRESEVIEALPRIVEFAELGDVIGEPVRTYSSGMVMRLAFSVAVHVNPAILIVDEVLGVGDSHFQEKCVDRIHGFRREGRTMLCVSHSEQMVVDFCDRALWLHHGQLVMDGDSSAVLHSYLAWSADPSIGVPQRTLQALA